MAKERRFELKSDVQQGGARRNAFSLQCCRCGKEEKLKVANEKGSLPSSVVSRKFRDKGWEVGRDDHHDKCGDCVEKDREAGRRLAAGKRQKAENHAAQAINTADHSAEEASTAMPHVEPRPVIHLPNGGEPPTAVIAAEIELPERADPPRVMAKIDRRNIIVGIETYYQDEKNGYSEGWSDKRVADQLKVPLAWVRIMREENFGPEHKAVDFFALKTEQDSIRAELLSLRQQEEAAIEAAKRLVKSLDDLRSTMDTRMSSIEVLLGNLRKLSHKIAEAEERV